MTTETNQTELPRIEVTDLTKFVQILAAWHSNKVNELQHLLSIPDEGHISVSLLEDGQESELMLQGDLLQGFKAGLKVALTALGTLPFGVTFEEPEASADASADAESPNEPVLVDGTPGQG